MKNIIDGRWAALVAIAIGAGACTPTTTQRLGLAPLSVVPRVDLGRYVGTWYEIARFPHRFQRGCTGTTATYKRRPDGEITVINRCRLGSPVDGELKVARGRARVVDPSTNAKLEVTFFWPFWGDYWIIDLDAGYRYAVVGHPSRDYLWILSRTPTLDEATLGGILRRLTLAGYEISRLKRTKHAEDAP